MSLHPLVDLGECKLSTGRAGDRQDVVAEKASLPPYPVLIAEAPLAAGAVLDDLFEHHLAGGA